MATFKLIALTTPAAGREAEFHEWYQNTHLHELCALHGVKSAQRYQLVAKLVRADENSWLAIYDIDCDDPASFLTALGEASVAGRLTQSDASEASTTYTALFAEHGARVEATRPRE